ncbi:polysaccharide biosynthesis/export family protein [Sphingomonas cavernae]|nr:polysaccharide biosynthesis/export family protein [Sphingomonas cavernae]
MSLRRVVLGHAAAIALPFAACAAQQPAPPAPAAAVPAYTLGAGEALKVTTFGEPTLTGDFTIDADGNLPLPLIGAIPAAGKTAQQLEAAIQTRLADGFLLNPRVTVEVKSYKPVYVLGEVNKPGEYAYIPGMTALAAVAKAEGFTYRAQQKKIFIKRAGESAERELALKGSVAILPGDTIRIAERYF